VDADAPDPFVHAGMMMRRTQRRAVPGIVGPLVRAEHRVERLALARRAADFRSIRRWTLVSTLRNRRATSTGAVKKRWIVSAVAVGCAPVCSSVCTSVAITGLLGLAGWLA
jgi:hypothetical protein